VLSGTHKGETGMIVQVERGVCAVVGDATRTQFRVNARDLTENVEREPGLEVGPVWVGLGWQHEWVGVEGVCEGRGPSTDVLRQMMHRSSHPHPSTFNPQPLPPTPTAVW